MLYLSKGTLHMLRGAYRNLGELKGSEMVGWTYTGPFDELPAEQTPGGFTHLNELTANVTQSAAEAHRVIPWEAVGESEGTGIVHIAPGCGAEDFQLGRRIWVAPGGSTGRRRALCRRLRLADRRTCFSHFRTDLCRPGAEGHALPRRTLYPPLPHLLALQNRAGFPPGGRVVHQHGSRFTISLARSSPPKRKRTACATRSWMWSTRSRWIPEFGYSRVRWIGCATCTIG